MYRILKAIQPGLRADKHQIAAHRILCHPALEMGVEPDRRCACIASVTVGHVAQIFWCDDLGAQSQFEELPKTSGRRSGPCRTPDARGLKPASTPAVTPAVDHVIVEQKAIAQTLALLRVDEALQIDAIIRKCEDSASADVLAAVSELELLGAIEQLPGKNFVLAWRD